MKPERRILLAFVLLACGPGPLELTPDEPNGMASNEEQPVEQPVLETGRAACSASTAGLAVQTMLRGPVVRLERFESDGHVVVAVLGGDEFASELSLRLTMGECTDGEWRLAAAVPIGVIPRIAGGDPGRYDGADVQMSAVELTSE